MNGISIALIIHSLEGSLWEFYRLPYSVSWSLVIRSLDLSAQLIPRRGFGLVWLGLLDTFRDAGALKGWCAVRTLQEMVGRGFLSHSLSVRLIPPYKCTKSS